MLVLETCPYPLLGEPIASISSSFSFGFMSGGTPWSSSESFRWCAAVAVVTDCVQHSQLWALAVWSNATVIENVIKQQTRKIFRHVLHFLQEARNMFTGRKSTGRSAASLDFMESSTRLLHS